ncbi:uncharacterized protein LOC135151133 [Daucus carota subsp. sativus]|uniref:uncharacterized protein LOC135151133 n=1 Tax=Daucus carota subsp. sativus TaxID=79200 RepID=UPI003083E0BF
METEIEWPTYVRDFFKVLTCDDCSSNELPLPHKFCDMQQDNLSGSWILSIRNGYQIHVVYDRQSMKLLGVSDLFSDFGLIGGEILLFESVDLRVFNVYIMGEDGCEIQYPEVVHRSQICCPVPVSISDGGWKFVNFISLAFPTEDKVAPPRSFMRMFGSVIPEWFIYKTKDNGIFGGHYEFLERKLSGMRRVCEVLRLVDFSLLELMVFTYDGGRVFKLNLFDGHNVEIGLDVNVVVSGSLASTLRQCLHFKIEVMPSHMLRYCHGVCVPTQFQRLTASWKKKDKIRVYRGGMSWEFEIRKRRPGNQTAIHGGWIEFRQEIELKVGDCCFFWCLDESNHHFRLEIVKSSG